MSSPLKQNTTTIQELLNTINSLPEAGGVELPALTNEGSASDLLSGKELIDGDGNIVTGSFTIDNELTTQDNLITQIQTALQGKASAPAAEDLDAELTEQEGLISQLSTILDSKVSGGGSGGGSVGTCTVTIYTDATTRLIIYGYSQLNSDGTISVNYVDLGAGTYGATFTFSNVICGSLLYTSAGSIGSLYVDDFSGVSKLGDQNILWKVPTTNVANCFISFIDDD